MNSQSRYFEVTPEHAVAGIIVHHKSYDTIATTARMIREAGLPASNLIVVDNSEQPGRRQELERGLGGVEVVYTANKGYGAAVNMALKRLRSTHPQAEYVLVATHEVQPRGEALRELLRVMASSPSVAAAGPTLLIGSGAATRVWSCGGSRSTLLHAHKHVIPDAPLEHLVALAESTDRRWLDGAYVLYRLAALPDPAFDERYFMYMEEVDLHYHLTAAGWRCVWVPSAVVTQNTSLTPTFYFTRNVRLFFRRNEGSVRAVIAPPLLIARELERQVRARSLTGLVGAIRGTFTRIPGDSGRA